MKRYLIYTGAALAGLVLLVGGAYAQKGHGGGHGGGGPSGGGHGGGQHSSGRSNAGHAAPRQGPQHASSTPVHQKQPGGKNTISKTNKPGNTTKTPGTSQSGTKGSQKQSLSSAKRSGTKSNPKAGGKTSAGGKQTKTGGPSGGKPKALDPAVAQGIKDLLGKVGDAVVLGALNNLLNGQVLSNAQLVAVGQFCGDPGCGLSPGERRFLQTTVASCCCDDDGGEVVVVEADED
jgi:hypothetical protein